jgi:hypothetical protein
MNYQSQEGIALDGFLRINGDFVVRTALGITNEPGVYKTGYWVAPKFAGQGLRHGGGERRDSLRVRLPWRESDQ